MGRRAAEGRGDITIVEGQTVPLRDRRRLIGEAVRIKGAEEPVTASITRKDPSCSISPMGGRSQTEDEHAGPGVPKARDRSPPVFPVPEAANLDGRHVLPKSSQPGAPGTPDHLPLNLGQVLSNPSHTVYFHSRKDRCRPAALLASSPRLRVGVSRGRILSCGKLNHQDGQVIRPPSAKDFLPKAFAPLPRPSTLEQCLRNLLCLKHIEQTITGNDKIPIFSPQSMLSHRRLSHHPDRTKVRIAEAARRHKPPETSNHVRPLDHPAGRDDP